MPIVWRYYFIFSLNEKFTLALVCMNKLHGRGGDMEFALKVQAVQIYVLLSPAE